MNRVDTLRALANEQNGGMFVVVSAKNDDYILGITKQNVKKDYYTKIFVENGGEMVVKAGESLEKNVAVTLQGSADDSIEYMYGTLWGYTIGPWNMSLLAKMYGTNSKEFERQREKFKWHPEKTYSRALTIEKE